MLCNVKSTVSTDQDTSSALRAKPLKRRSLSKHYHSKSQSFSSFEIALGTLRTAFGDSSNVLGKSTGRALLAMSDFSNSLGNNNNCSSSGASPQPSAEVESPSSCCSDTAGSSWSASSALTDEICNDFVMALNVSRPSPRVLARLSRTALQTLKHSESTHLPAGAAGPPSPAADGQHCTSSSGCCSGGGAPLCLPDLIRKSCSSADGGQVEVERPDELM